MRDSQIAWTHHTFNPWVGCSALHCEVREECYASPIVKRAGGDFSVIRQTSSEIWSKVYDWNDEGMHAGKCSRVFCLSMGDFFDPQADGLRPTVWQLIREASHLVFMILTKNPNRTLQCLPQGWGPSGYPNVWLGTSISCNHPRILERLDHLRTVPAATRFISAEPLRGPLTGIDLSGFGLLIVGGESGPTWNEHEMKLAWAKGAYDIAKSKGVKYFFKQISAAKDEQGIDALGTLIPPYKPQVIREMPDGPFPWMDIEEKGDRTKEADLVSIST